jgi:hypothetical protein
MSIACVVRAERLAFPNQDLMNWLPQHGRPALHIAESFLSFITNPSFVVKAGIQGCLLLLVILLTSATLQRCDPRAKRRTLAFSLSQSYRRYFSIQMKRTSIFRQAVDLFDFLRYGCELLMDAGYDLVGSSPTCRIHTQADHRA